MEDKQINKKVKPHKKKKKMQLADKISIVMSVLATLVLVAILVGIVMIASLLKGKPELNVEDFNPTESSIVLDRDGNQISELGTVIRQNVTYEDLPTSLIDAFVAVEDSRYFEHNGFDVPRFTMAFLKNLRTLSFSQGGSTFTMQLVKNTYFVSDDAGTGAAKSIQRKIQEIALSLELEGKTSKKEIFVNYLNKLNFGGTNQNIRGVQKAAQYYFGKDVSDLTLPESAMLAGVINGPSLYNPYNHLDYAQDRRDEVLYLMNYHGYITDTEYKNAVATKVEDFLYDSSKDNKGSHNGIPYQAYVDAVVSEVYELTGLDPYTTSMVIHTNMDKNVQELIDEIQAGNVNDYFAYPDEEFEVASVVLNNKTGEVVGILGGRNYSDGGALLLNHATDQFKQPGSSIKPVLVYSQMFEVLGYSTSHVVVDRPLSYIGTDLIIANSTGTYRGEVTLKDAVANSLNTPAISIMRELQEAKGDAYLISYLKSLGFNISADDFDEQYAIGGKGLQVSCLQLAGAYGALLNGGYYTAPHTIKKIEFISDKAPYIPTYNSKQTISEESCYLMSELLKNNVNGGYPNLMGIFKDEYDVYAKTGTTNYGVEGATYNIPNGSIKDGWVVAGSSEYTVATWMGYEKAQADKPSYMTYALYNQNIKGKITNLLLDKTVELYGKPESIQRPSGVTSITHILGTFPYASTIDDMDDDYITTGYINRDSKYASLVSPKNVGIENISSDGRVVLTNKNLRIEWPTYPNEKHLKEVDEEMDISLLKKDGSVLLGAVGNRLFDYSWIYGKIIYKADILSGSTVLMTVTSEDESKSVDISNYLSKDNLSVDLYYGYEKLDSVTSNKSNKTFNTDISITIPQGSAETVLNGLKEYTSNVRIEEVVNNDLSEGTVIEITYKGSSYKPGNTITDSYANIMNHEFVIKKSTMNITITPYDESKDDEFAYASFKASTNQLSFTWSCSSSHATLLSSDSNSAKFKFDKSGTYTIVAKYGNQEFSKTYEVEVPEASEPQND